MAMDSYCWICQALHFSHPMGHLKSLQKAMTAVREDDSTHQASLASAQHFLRKPPRHNGPSGASDCELAVCGWAPAKLGRIFRQTPDSREPYWGCHVPTWNDQALPSGRAVSQYGNMRCGLFVRTWCFTNSSSSMAIVGQMWDVMLRLP